MNKLIIDDKEVNLSDETVSELKKVLGVKENNTPFYSFIDRGTSQPRLVDYTDFDLIASQGKLVAEDYSTEVYLFDSWVYFRNKSEDND